MIYRYSHIRLIRLAGLIIWISLCVPLFFALANPNREAFIYLAAHVLFGLGFWLVTSNFGRMRQSIKVWSTLIFLITVIFIINQVTDSAIGIFYALIISVLLPWLLSVRKGLMLMLFYNVLIGVQFKFFVSNASEVLVQYLLFFVYLGFSVFSFIISLVAYRQQYAKEELRQLNTELRATQVLLTDSSRINERLRISRELHDLIGHHLTALTLNLEAASHITEGKSKSYVQKAQSIARLLLSDVREVVSQFRNSGTLDLGLALRKLLEGIPDHKVHSDIPDDFLVEDPKLAQTILRCTQELITNTMKHAKANNLWVSAERDRDEIRLWVRDDGVGIKDLSKGNGLTGIEERVKYYNGRFDIDSQKGLSVRLSFPI